MRLFALHLGITGSLVACAMATGGCPPPATEPSIRRPLPPKPIPLPPTASTQAQLKRWASSGRCAATWRRASLLLDYYDATRFLDGEADRVSRQQRKLGEAIAKVLDASLGLGEGAEASARRAALDRIFATVKAPCPHVEDAERARTLLRADGMPRDNHAQRLAVAIAIKQVALQGGRLATNARLRLADACADALRDAARADPPAQQAEANRCLYALYEADPAPYFASDAALRPPDPPWTLLRDDLDRALRRLEGSRLGKLASLQRAFDRAFFLTAKAELPSPLALSRLSLPQSRQGLPHERTPIITLTPRGVLVDGLIVPSGQRKQLRDALSRRLKGDTRATLTVVAPPETSLGGLFELGRAARRLQVATLLLGVRRRIADAAPEGDVQARIGGAGEPVWRLEGIPISIRLLSIHPGEPSRDRPRRLLYDPRSVQARLALTYDPARGVVVSSRDGRLPLLPSTASRKQLQDDLTFLRGLYPHEAALIVAPTRTTTYAQMLQLVQRLRFRGRRPLFPSVALASFHSVASPARDLRRYARWTRGAKVMVAPATALPTVALSSLRACYLSALRAAHREDRAAPTGQIQLGSRRARRAWSKVLNDKPLVTCLEGALPQKPPKATLTFAVPVVSTSQPLAPKRPRP